VVVTAHKVNANATALDSLFMPGPNWNKDHPELNLEVVGLDLNKFMEGWNRDLPLDELHFNDCQWTSCSHACLGIAEQRAREAFDLFGRRLKQSTRANLLVFSHYPTDYFTAKPAFLANLSRADKHVTYFAGHRHNTDQTSTVSTAPNTNWVVGGGGGWSCDGREQGFVVGEVGADSTVRTYSVLVDLDLCCASFKS